MIRRTVPLCLTLAAPALGQATLNGAYATFPNPMYQKSLPESGASKVKAEIKQVH